MLQEIVGGKITKVEISLDGKISFIRNKREVKTCDICKEEIKNDAYEHTDIEVDASIGNRYPEGDCRTGYTADFCKTCFLEKVKPLLESSFGFTFREYECDSYDGFTEEIVEPLDADEVNGIVQVLTDTGVKIFK